MVELIELTINTNTFVITDAAGKEHSLEEARALVEAGRGTSSQFAFIWFVRAGMDIEAFKMFCQGEKLGYRSKNKNS